MMKRKFWIIGGLVLLGIVLGIALSQMPSTWFKPDYLVDLSSVLTLISFTVRSMVSLRLLAIGAQLTFIPYCLLQPTPLWTPIVWNLLFMGVNVCNLIILMLEKRPVVLNADEQKLYDLAFKTLSPREFLKLTTFSEFRDGKAGEPIFVQGEQSPYISILIDGEAAAVFEGEKLVNISEGRLLGLPSVLAAEPQTYGIILDAPSRYCRWSVVQLRRFLDKTPDIRDKFRMIVSKDLLKTIRGLEDLHLKEMRENKLESDATG